MWKGWGTNTCLKFNCKNFFYKSTYINTYIIYMIFGSDVDLVHFGWIRLEFNLISPRFLYRDCNSFKETKKTKIQWQRFPGNRVWKLSFLALRGKKKVELQKGYKRVDIPWRIFEYELTGPKKNLIFDRFLGKLSQVFKVIFGVPTITAWLMLLLFSSKHPFLTRKWDADEDVDRRHWVSRTMEQN